MKGIVEQYARGEFKVDRPQIAISVSKIELNIEAGTVHEGLFTVDSENNCPVKLMVYDSRYILDFKSHTFVGRKNKVYYSFDARGLEQGKSFKGHINIITDGGEFVVPYHISIIAPYIKTENRKLEDLFQFASYAEENWEDAIRIFGSEDFVRTFIGRDEKLLRVYESLGLSLSIGQAMEEFLVYTHKKRALTLSVAQDDLLIEMPTELVRASVAITKNTWGYTDTNIASDCDFIIPETTKLKWNSFDGNTFELTFLIDPQRIHDGESTGYIYIWNTYQNIRIRVSIRKPEVIKMTPKSRQTRFTIKRAEEALTKAYIDFRTNKTDLSRYISDTRDALNTLIKYRPEFGMYRLGLLHMQILEGHTEFVEQEFLRIDADANLMSMDDMEKCYLSYLKALLRKEKFLVDKTARMVREKFESNKGRKERRLFFFWILLFVDVSYTEDKWVLYEDIQKLFNEGVNSPVIYFELCDMFNKQPLMMKKIAPLEIAAIRWGMRNEFVSEDVIVEYVKTASRQKEFDEQAFKLLEHIYDIKHDRTVLDAICGILIRNKMNSPQYHRYYRDASEIKLKYVGLNECFIKSMDKTRYDEIPEAILRYFSYKNVLDDKELGYIYANVIMNKEKQPSVYRDFVPAIERYMEKMILLGNVSDDLTVIYDEFLDPDMVKPEFASKLINIIFKRKFVCDNENVKYVLVSHSELSGEVKIPVVDNEAYVEIISPSAVITLLDENGGRFVSTVPYRVERIVDERSYLDICQQYCPRDYRYLIFLYNDIDIFTHRDAKEINLARDIVLCPEVSYRVRQEALTHMVEYYHENFDADILGRYLSKIDLDYVDPSYASRINTYYITLNMFDRAFEGMYRFGYVDVDIDELIKIAEYGIDDKRYDETRLLISICVYIYRRGYAGQKVLSYLINNYNGSLEEMSNLFKSVNSNYRNIDMLSENILAQMMFADGYIESIYDIFEVYYRGRSRGMVVKAFLRYCAHQYFIKEQRIPSNIMEDLYKEISKGNITDEISKMSLLYYFSNKAARCSAEQQEWIREVVRRFVENSKVLPFFKKFEAIVKLPSDVRFKTYVIFKGEGGKQVWISYSFGQESISMANYKCERMNEIIPGVYVKELVVFHGESLIYSIDGVVGTSTVIESDILKNDNMSIAGDSSFELINKMIVSQETRNDNALIQTMDTYLYDRHFFDANLMLL